MRELSRHKQNPVNNEIKITVLDEPGIGGACHDYRFDIPDGDSWILCFQNGPVAEAGVNGITHEALLAVLIDRLEGFQSGPYHNEHNAVALQHLECALLELNKRTQERIERGVEGTHTV